MKRIFLVVYLMLMAVAVIDCLIRSSGQPALDLTGWALVFAASSVSAVMLASVVFLAGDAYWFVCVPAVVWGISCSGMEWFFRRFFSSHSLVGEELMVSIVTMSQEKVVAFVCENWTACEYVAYAAGVVAVLVSVAWMTSRSVGRPTWRSIISGLVLFVGMGCLVPLVMDRDHLMMALLDHEFVRGSENLSMYRELKEGGERLPDGSYSTTMSNLLAVIVIGESSTRNHWSLYGYSRPTTPRLAAQADQLLVLSNVSAKVALTPYALRDLFTAPIGHRVVSVPSAAVAAGYEVALYSGQAKTGMYDGSDELLFSACRTRQYLCEILPNGSYHDGALIPLVRQAVTSAVPTQLVFVHTYGSHCNWSARFPPSFDRFTEDLEGKEVQGLSRSAAMSVNDYDNSILYTDYVVSELLRTVQSQERPAVFVYVADHGESPRSVGRNHDHPDTHAIPCFLWFSEGYRRLHPNLVQRVQALCKANLVSTELFPLWLDLLGIVHLDWSGSVPANSADVLGL